MNLYEMTYILRTDLDDDGLKAAQERVVARMNDAGGEVVKTEGWGRRRLAYPIDKMRDGMYFTTIFRMPGDGVKAFENQLRLTSEVLRFLVISQQESNINLTGSLIPSGFSHRATATPAPATEAAAGEGEVATEGEPAEAGTAEEGTAAGVTAAANDTTVSVATSENEPTGEAEAEPGESSESPEETAPPEGPTAEAAAVGAEAPAESAAETVAEPAKVEEAAPGAEAEPGGKDDASIGTSE